MFSPTLFRRLVIILLAVAFVAGVAWLWWGTGWQVTAPWRETAPGIEVCVMRQGYFAPPATVTAVRADPARCRIRVVDEFAPTHGAGASAAMVCPPVGAAINASFFAGENLSPIGLVIADGHHLYPTYQKAGSYGPWGYFRLRHRQPELIGSEDVATDEVTQAVQCAPRLVVQGRMQTFRPLPAARRAAVGLDARGRVILAVADGLISFPCWAECLRRQLNCREALNLDGGPSAQLAVHGATSVDVAGGVSVPVFLTVEPVL